MKVLFLTGSLKQGGAEFQLISLAKLFKDNGNQVRILALTDHQFYKNLVDEFDIDYSFLSNDLSRIKRTYLTVRAVNSFKPDYIISYLRSVSLVAIAAKFFSSVRTRLITSERTSLTIPYYDGFYFFLSRYADALTVNSQFKLRYISERYPALSKKVFFFPNILDLNRFPKDIPAKQNKELTLAYVGRIAPEKNLDKLIAAVNILHNEGIKIELDLYGDVKHSKYYSELLKQIAQLQLVSHVRMHPATGDVVAVYCKTDAICLMSEYEGFSNVLSEALACGCPIIASDIEENQFLVEESVNGFLVKNTIQDIARGIRKFSSLGVGQRHA
ncbi:MAG TPA: glycosyltransferase, partial [Chryseosolibacter sp.]